jgi:hypothetical protein
MRRCAQTRSLRFEVTIGNYIFCSCVRMLREIGDTSDEARDCDAID